MHVFYGKSHCHDNGQIPPPGGGIGCGPNAARAYNPGAAGGDPGSAERKRQRIKDIKGLGLFR